MKRKSLVIAVIALMFISFGTIPVHAFVDPGTIGAVGFGIMTLVVMVNEFINNSEVQETTVVEQQKPLEAAPGIEKSPG